MSATTDLLTKTIVELARTLAAAGEFFSDFTPIEYGLVLPEAVLTNGTVSQQISTLSSAADNLAGKAEELAVALESGGDFPLGPVLQTADAIRLFATALPQLINSLENAANSSAELTAPQKTSVANFLANFGTVFLESLAAQRIADFSEPTLLFLSVLGIAEWRLVAGDGTELFEDHIVMRLRLDRLPDIFKKPEQHFQDTLGWGTDTFDPEWFFNVYRQFHSSEAAIVVDRDAEDHPFLRWGVFRIGRRTVSPTVHGLEIGVNLSLTRALETAISVGETWALSLKADLALAGEFTLTIDPPLEVSLPTPSLSAGGSVDFVFQRAASARPWNLVETGGLISLSVDNVSAGFGIAAELNNNSLAFEPRLFAGLSQLKLKIGSADGDGFLAKIISGAELEATFDLDLEFVPSKGLRVRAAGGVEIMLPIHKDIGPLEIQQFFLGLYIKDDGTLDLETSMALGANLGPLKAVVERMGAKTVTAFLDNAEAEFGNIDASLGFKPPSGVGLSLDAGVIKGGGYLYIDTDRGEYAGALELTFSEWIALKAIGLISTRLPDGSEGFSLLLIITVEFGSGIQLGFGFTLIGVGGLLGLNRRTDIEPLAASIRTGAIESVMFPQNVIENAPKIISDLRSFFPTQEGTFLIGPMVKIGWGTPTLLSLSMGVIIELPDPIITILGVIKVALPTEEAAVLKLQVNFIGRIEFSNKLAWFYAELYDSRVLFITLEGGMGVLVNWGDQPNFVVSVGGFHPDFTPPPLPFPSPPRLAASILDTSFARVRIEGYFAVTSNSVQFGARAELFFGVSAFNIEGHLGFDALFIFSPFYFSFGISVKLSVKVFGIGLFSVGFSGKLEGPTPWHIKGKGSISLLFFSISVPFEHTWGEENNTELPPISVLPLLVEELEAVSNWQADLPAGANLLVSLRQLGDGENDQLVLHPIGTLVISQRKVPLGIEMEKFGNQAPDDARELIINVAGTLNKLGDREEQFALGHFKDLNEAEKLSKPSFQPMKGGVSLSAGASQTTTGSATARSLRYETIIIDDIHRSLLFVFLTVLTQMISTIVRRSRRNPVRRADLSVTRQLELAPLEQKIKLSPDQFTVVSQANNKPVGTLESVTFSSQVQANEHLRKQQRTDPVGAAQLHVIPATEVNLRS